MSFPTSIVFRLAPPRRLGHGRWRPPHVPKAACRHHLGQPSAMTLSCVGQHALPYSLLAGIFSAPVDATNRGIVFPSNRLR
jgi:hypothetical protein